MSLSLRKIAVVGGSGHLGLFILKGLLANPSFEVSVVSRQSSTAQFPPGVNVVKVGDEYPKNEMIDVFRKHDAVALSLNNMAEAKYHNTLVDASVEAGVKRLITSTFGGHSDAPEAREVFPFAKVKGLALDHAKFKAESNLGWTYTAVACGLFIEMCIPRNFFGINPTTHTGKIWGDGTQKFPCTNMETVGLSVAKILERPEETANKVVYISSFEPSLNDLLAEYKHVTGIEEWTITHGDIDEGVKEAKEVLSTPDISFMDRMKSVARLGLLVCPKPGIGSNMAAEGVLDNELLGLPRGDLRETFKRAIKV